ncbi:MAG: DNA-binding protein [Candidatus Bathyarchaeia archaeon]|nr:DNA-binding protein [Candidatus Bathyarchaeota archaeon]
MIVFKPKESCFSIYKLDFNDDLLNAIKEAAEKVDSGFFWVIGAVSKAKFSFYDQKKKVYREILIDKPLEITSCIGNIAEFNGKKIIHAHITFSDELGNAFGGHLIEGTKIFSAEMFLIEFKNFKLRRCFDQITGLNLFSP